MRDNKKTDKIISIYHAVEDIIAEGVDLATMRVSDIAAKAGIGKGTTYEYFTSKEELVVKAMIYLVDSMTKRIISNMEKKDGFRDKFMLLLEEMEEKVKQRACILKYFHMLGDLNLCESMHDLLLDNDEEAENANPMRIIRYLLEEGKKEGLIGDKFSQSYMETVMFSKIIAFVVYIDNVFGNKDHDNEVIKNDIYDGLCRELGA